MDTAPGSPARALIWDFDGTLAERPGRWSGAVLAALREVTGDTAVTDAMVRDVLRHGYPWHRPDVPHPELADPDVWWQSLAAVLGRAVQRLGVEPQAAAEVGRRVRRHYADPASFVLYDDVHPVLTRLSELGWEHVVLSNHVPELPQILASLGIAWHFRAVVNSAVTGYEKPHPQAFRLALELAGSPRSAWMIGDNPVADIGGAAAAGLPAIQVRTRPADGSAPITDLADVIEIVSRPA
jgi:putative hydrolase of the HAD superfamily